MATRVGGISCYSVRSAPEWEGEESNWRCLPTHPSPPWSSIFSKCTYSPSSDTWVILNFPLYIYRVLGCRVQQVYNITEVGVAMVTNGTDPDKDKTVGVPIFSLGNYLLSTKRLLLEVFNLFYFNYQSSSWWIPRSSAQKREHQRERFA